MMTKFFRSISAWAWANDVRWLVTLIRYAKGHLVTLAKTQVTIEVKELEARLLTVRKSLEGKGIDVLEVGPKSGVHSCFIDRYFHPEKLVLLERPPSDSQERDLTPTWFLQLECKKEMVYSDLLLARNLLERKFDLVFCLGVIYHNVEYFKIFNILHRLLKDNGYLVLGTDLSSDTKPTILLNYREGQISDLTRPSRKAIEIIMKMTGFSLLESADLPYPNQRGFFLAQRGPMPSTAVQGYSFGGSAV